MSTIEVARFGWRMTIWGALFAASSFVLSEGAATYGAYVVDKFTDLNPEAFAFAADELGFWGVLGGMGFAGVGLAVILIIAPFHNHDDFKDGH